MFFQFVKNLEKVSAAETAYKIEFGKLELRYANLVSAGKRKIINSSVSAVVFF